MLGRAVIGAVEYACLLLKERVDVTCVEGRGDVVGKKVLYLRAFGWSPSEQSYNAVR